MTWCLHCCITHAQTDILMSLLFSLKSLAEEVNRLTKYSRILAARSRLHTVSYVLTPDMPGPQNFKYFPVAFGLIHIFIFIHRQCWSFRQKCFFDRVTRCRTVSSCLKQCLSFQLSFTQLLKTKLGFCGVFVHVHLCNSAQSWRNNIIKLLLKSDGWVNETTHNVVIMFTLSLRNEMIENLLQCPVNLCIGPFFFSNCRWTLINKINPSYGPYSHLNQLYLHR